MLFFYNYSFGTLKIKHFRAFFRKVAPHRLFRNTGPYNILLNQYHEKCVNVMNKVVSTLDSGKSITIDNKKFDCSIKFLDYLSKNRNSEFFPHQELQKIQTKVVENRKELELSKNKGLELDL